MKSTAISKMARLWKYNAPSEFNPPLCPSFLPLIPLEEARYSSRYCPQAQPGAPQAAPRADRAPMQSRERLACGTWEDHRIQTRPPESKLDLATCRMQGARVIAWARDLLSAQLEAHRVAPGGNIGSCIGLLQEELEEEMKGKAED